MTISAGMQPYFFPYLGYFDLIYNSDVWVIFDTPQFVKEGWMNRNRVLHPTKAWRYVTVPVRKAPLGTPLNQIQISEEQDWRKRILRSLEHYRKHAPFFATVMELVEECLSLDTRLLSELNVFALQRACELIGIPFDNCVFSNFSDCQFAEGDVDPQRIRKTADWAIQITKSLGAGVLINPPGGHALYDPQEFRDHGIELIIREFPAMSYSTGPYSFEPNLSIIDVLMWNSAQKVKEYLDQVQLHR